MSHPSSSLVYSVHDYPVPGTTKIVFFFCPFGFKSWPLALPGMPIWHLRRNGYSVIAYSYKTAIAITSVQMTLDNIEAMIRDAHQKIVTTDPSIEISCFGTSMGTVMAANVAAQHKRIKKVILNLSYADISDHIVNLPSIRTISSERLKAYLATVGNEHHLRNAFDPFSPLKLVHDFKEKSMLIYSSKDDRILKLVHTAKFHAALRDAHIDFHYYENRWGGHFFAALINFFRYGRYIRFLNAQFDIK